MEGRADPAQISYRASLLDWGRQERYRYLSGQAVLANIVAIERQDGMAKGVSQMVDHVRHADLNTADAKGWEYVKDESRTDCRRGAAPFGLKLYPVGAHAMAILAHPNYVWRRPGNPRNSAQTGLPDTVRPNDHPDGLQYDQEIQEKSTMG